MKRQLSARLVPATLPAQMVLALTILFGILSGLRGYDWITNPSSGLIAPVIVHAWGGLVLWGSLLVLGAGVLLGGIAARKHFPTWCGHMILTATYFGVSLAVLWAVYQSGGGIQAALAPIGGVIWHAVLARRMRPLPRQAAARG